MRYGFIGTGNMGGALALAAAKAVPQGDIYLFNRTAAKAEALAASTGARVAKSAAEIADECDVIFLGVKPYQIESVVHKIAPQLNGNTLLVSMAAGVSMADMRAFSGGAAAVARIMPNTPVAVGCGEVLLCAGDEVSDELRTALLLALSKAGRVDAVPESLMDAGSALSGCGPAFVYMFIEALADGGVECGLSRAQAQALAAQTVLGAARMVLESGGNPGALKDAVCSPGGTTIAGVHALERGGLRAGAMDAVTAAYQKTLSLAKHPK